jgi:hypothetical protein
MIISELTPASIGAGVIYKPENQQGYITSFNDRYVFVSFPRNMGRGEAVMPEDLDFITAIKTAPVKGKGELYDAI